jgi:Domain of unknown function (DUF3859)
VTHPPMIKPGGNTWKSETTLPGTTVTNGSAVVMLTYKFNEDYKMIPGLWRIEVKYQGERMVSQEFMVYKE